MRKFTAFLLLLLSFSLPSFAQFYPTQYRPPGQNWRYLSTPHFKLVYGRGNDSTAMQMARILETHYGPVQKLVGGDLDQFPVILNDYNDRSNGFVTPFHFRSEIELPPIKGKTLNPQTGNWLQNVGPHELVHALQFSNLGNYNLPRFVSLFSPDLARSFHGAIPAGMLEGIAVEHETKGITPHGGRGHYPLFTNQFNAVFKSDRRWSMGQLMQLSSETRPFDRHYIGGYEFTSWLQDEFGPSTTKEALNYYMNYPFLGYGVALRHVTGLWPKQLYHRFENTKKKDLAGKDASNRGTELNIPYKGREIRRPKWLSDSKLLFYGSFYNARPGFYSYNMPNGHVKRLIATNSVGDYRYDLSQDRSRMIYSYYKTDPIYDYTSKAEVVQYDFSNGRKHRLTQDGRVYAPVFSGDRLYALQTRSASSRLVSLEKADLPYRRIGEVVFPEHDQIIAVAPNPMNNKWAVVVNKSGRQSLWIVDGDSMHQGLTQQQPDISFDTGSVFDPAWHPDGHKLLFSSDFSGTQQVYEFNLLKHTVSQVTNSTFNAFEASYSPDGHRIAFIKQDMNERLPVVLAQSNFYNKNIPLNLWQTSESGNVVQGSGIADSLISQSGNWESGDYSTGTSWLTPRTILPVFDEISNQGVYRAGFSLNSNSLLAEQSYTAELAYAEDRAWYDITYQNKSFYPGFKARLFSRPSYRFFQTGSPNGTIVNTLLRQERSLALSVPLRVRLNQNVYRTSFFIEPEIRQSQVRYFEVGGRRNKSGFSNNTIANIYGQFNFRLQQNARDFQPNSGLILFAELERHLDSDAINFTAYGNNVSLFTRKQTGLNGGVFAFFSPLRKWNQSMRLGLRGITQSAFIFDNQSVVSEGFSEPIFVGSRNLLSFNTRYTIPLTYVDDGGLLLPFYLSSIYLVAFSNTVTDPTFHNWYRGSRSVFGIGIRAWFRLSNLSFNIGFGYGYEPTRKASEFFVGDF